MVLKSAYFGVFWGVGSVWWPQLLIYQWYWRRILLPNVYILSLHEVRLAYWLRMILAEVIPEREQSEC
jgi:hypothetical protein